MQMKQHMEQEVKIRKSQFWIHKRASNFASKISSWSNAMQREEEGVSDLEEDLGGDDPGDEGGDIGLGEPELGDRDPTWAEMKEA